MDEVDDEGDEGKQRETKKERLTHFENPKASVLDQKSAASGIDVNIDRNVILFI